MITYQPSSNLMNGIFENVRNGIKSSQTLFWKWIITHIICLNKDQNDHLVYTITVHFPEYFILILYQYIFQQRRWNRNFGGVRWRCMQDLGFLTVLIHVNDSRKESFTLGIVLRVEKLQCLPMFLCFLRVCQSDRTNNIWSGSVCFSQRK